MRLSVATAKVAGLVCGFVLLAGWDVRASHAVGRGSEHADSRGPVSGTLQPRIPSPRAHNGKPGRRETSLPATLSDAATMGDRVEGSVKPDFAELVRRFQSTSAGTESRSPAAESSSLAPRYSGFREIAGAPAEPHPQVTARSRSQFWAEPVPTMLDASPAVVGGVPGASVLVQPAIAQGGLSALAKSLTAGPMLDLGPRASLEPATVAPAFSPSALGDVGPRQPFAGTR